MTDRLYYVPFVGGPLCGKATVRRATELEKVLEGRWYDCKDNAHSVRYVLSVNLDDSQEDADATRFFYRAVEKHDDCAV